jgi:uncharacterized protein (DUF58 family)
MIQGARPPAWIGPRGIIALLALALLALAIASIAPWPLAALIAAALAIGAFAADAMLTNHAPSIVRRLPRRLVLAVPDVFTYDVENRGGTALRFAITDGPAARLTIPLEPVAGRVDPGMRATVTMPVVPRERGATEIGRAFLWYESALGLIRRRAYCGEAVGVRVLPDLGGLDRGDLAQRVKLVQAGLRRVRRRGVGSEFESLRDYTSGDPFRAIDWKATARRGRVMVAQYEVERSQQIVVAIDAGRLMAARLGDRRKLDYAVSAALSIASAAQLSDDRVGIMAFAARTLATLAPRAGAMQSAAITDLLTELEPQFEDSDYERAVLDLRRRYRKRSLIVLFTDLFDPVASSAVLASAALLVPHHLVLVVLMNDAAIAEALDREPRNVTDAYRAGVAATLAVERERAVTLLASRGIGVVDVPAAQLSTALLDAYIEIKTRALL